MAEGTAGGLLRGRGRVRGCRRHGGRGPTVDQSRKHIQIVCRVLNGVEETRFQYASGKNERFNYQIHTKNITSYMRKS